jgi:hypothetical protein
MKLFLKFLTIFLLTINLNAQVISAFFENDVIDGEDKHYTNGMSFMYLSDKDTNDLVKYDNSFLNFISKIPTFNNNTKYQSLGMSISHFTFTPENSEKSEKIVNDVPYAGVAVLDFILYKWEENFFHEYAITLGMVGPSALAEKFQNEYHHLTGNNETNGWDNQLSDDFLYNFAYSYGYRAFRNDSSYGKIDLINSFRVDTGNYNRTAMIGSVIRYGNNYPDNFNTVGRFLGANENKILNLDSKTSNNLAWSISYGLGYSYTDYFYVTNYDKSYELDKLKDTILQVISFDTYFDKLVLSLTYKTSYFTRINNDAIKENWGGINISYLF